MSTSLFALAIIGLSEKIFRRKFFSWRDWKAAWIFGAVASLILYPSALGLTRIDIYSWGWSSWACNGLVAGVALITTFLFWKKNGFGLILLFALLAFSLHVKASRNFWDYLIDPFYGTLGIVLFLRTLL